MAQSRCFSVERTKQPSRLYERTSKQANERARDGIDRERSREIEQKGGKAKSLDLFALRSSLFALCFLAASCTLTTTMMDLSMALFEDKYVTAMLFTAIAGLSTGIGGLLVVLYGKPSFTKLGHMLSFSAGVMLYISFMDLLLESIAHVGFLTANLWVCGCICGWYACVGGHRPDV